MRRKSRKAAATGREPSMVLSPEIEPSQYAGAHTGLQSLSSAALPRQAGPQHPAWESMLTMFVVFMIYIASPIIVTSDSHFVIPTALSIIRHGDANIDEYPARFSEAIWAVHLENGHAWNVYPVGVPLLALPVVWVWDKAARLAGNDLESE